MDKQFDNVSSRYGAPMGRHSVPDLDTTRGTVRLFKVNLDSGGYDDGGAYWGHGGAIYCARDRNGDIQTVRAASRAHAAFLLEIPAPSLCVPFDWRRMVARWRDAGHLDADDIDAYAHLCTIVEGER